MQLPPCPHGRVSGPRVHPPPPAALLADGPPAPRGSSSAGHPPTPGSWGSEFQSWTAFALGPVAEPKSASLEERSSCLCPLKLGQTSPLCPTRQLFSQTCDIREVFAPPAHPLLPVSDSGSFRSSPWSALPVTTALALVRGLTTSGPAPRFQCSPCPRFLTATGPRSPHHSKHTFPSSG